MGREGFEAPSGSMGKSKAEQRRKNQVSKAKHDAIKDENQRGQVENAKARSENSEKAPMDDVVDVLTYVLKQDEKFEDKRNMIRYVQWVKKNINAIDVFDVPLNELDKEEHLTASVKAGGGGRQTSKNARGRKHLITGYHITSEKDRKAGPNVKEVMRLMNEDLRRHLRNWRVMMDVTDEKTIIDTNTIDKVVEGLV